VLRPTANAALLTGLTQGSRVQQSNVCSLCRVCAPFAAAHPAMLRKLHGLQAALCHMLPGKTHIGTRDSSLHRLLTLAHSDVLGKVISEGLSSRWQVQLLKQLNDLCDRD